MGFMTVCLLGRSQRDVEHFVLMFQDNHRTKIKKPLGDGSKWLLEQADSVDRLYQVSFIKIREIPQIREISRILDLHFY